MTDDEIDVRVAEVEMMVDRALGRIGEEMMLRGWDFDGFIEQCRRNEVIGNLYDALYPHCFTEEE